VNVLIHFHTHISQPREVDGFDIFSPNPFCKCSIRVASCKIKSKTSARYLLKVFFLFCAYIYLRYLHVICRTKWKRQSEESLALLAESSRNAIARQHLSLRRLHTRASSFVYNHPMTNLYLASAFSPAVLRARDNYRQSINGLTNNTYYCAL